MSDLLGRKKCGDLSYTAPLREGSYTCSECWGRFTNAHYCEGRAAREGRTPPECVCCGKRHEQNPPTPGGSEVGR